MTLVSVPGNGAWVGEAAASGFAVRVMKADGVTPEVGLAVTLSGSGGLVLGACGAASCVVVTDATGLASSAVTPALAGTLRLQAVAGSLQASASFTAVTRPDVLTLVSAPADGALVGDVAAAPFAVKVTLGGAGSARRRGAGAICDCFGYKWKCGADGVRRGELCAAYRWQRPGAERCSAEGGGGGRAPGGGWCVESDGFVYRGG